MASFQLEKKPISTASNSLVAWWSRSQPRFLPLSNDDRQPNVAWPNRSHSNANLWSSKAWRRENPCIGCQTFKCYFSSSNCLLTHISRCWRQYNQRERYWQETNFSFYTTTHEQHSWHVWPFAHLVVSVAKVFPCNIHDEGLAWKQDHRSPRIVEMGQKMPMHVPVLLFILHIWHQRWDEVASDVIIEPPFWAWIKHAKCNRSNDGQIFNINSKNHEFRHVLHNFLHTA